MNDHYFTTPDSPERRRQVTATIWDREHTFTTAAGVFSGDHLDHATAILTKCATPDPQARRLLDLGCGWGPLAVGLATSCPDAVVDAVDVNDRALTLCAENSVAAGVGDRVRALRPEAVDPGTRYDEIWSNPPIRIGKIELHALLLTWLARLSDTGVARLVVGKNLGADTLQSWLIDQDHPCVRIASAKGFRVLEITQSRRETPGPGVG